MNHRQLRKAENVEDRKLTVPLARVQRQLVLK